MILVCEGTYAPVAPPFQRSRGTVPRNAPSFRRPFWGTQRPGSGGSPTT